MLISFACEKCGRRYKVEESKIGAKANCTDCGAELEVPDPQTYVESGESESEAAETRSEPSETVLGGQEAIELISNHIEKHIGAIDGVIHESGSDLVPVDLHVVPPTDERPFYTVITSGMSDRPMRVPAELSGLRFAELLICLPPDWPLTQADFQDEANYWPLGLVKRLARLTHENDTWLGFGQTVPNSDPPQPYAENTQFSCALIGIPLLSDKEFWKLEVSESKTIHFYSVVPMYPEETDYKLSKGLDQLLQRFDKHQVSELLELDRRNVGKSRWKFF
ncbi:MAG: hypothetical protein CMJ78_25500 [Planctomycetaceae bacterium]|nr:hypothetical protein [Planctomycetaceae bacterium]